MANNHFGSNHWRSNHWATNHWGVQLVIVVSGAGEVIDVQLEYRVIDLKASSRIVYVRYGE